MQKEAKLKIVVIVGPTASGKSSLAIDLAKQFSGEIISADSRQVYRGLDIGTAKVTSEEMQGIPHHLLDVCDVNDLYTVTDFKEASQKLIIDITNRGKVPILAGGTFFYIDSLLEKISTPEVPPNPALRAELEEKNVDTLFASLEKLDPDRAATIEPQNKRRLIRALEIIAALGNVPTNADQLKPNPYHSLTIGIKTDRKALRAKIATRAPLWLKNGFREEIRQLLDSDVDSGRLREIGFEYQLGIELIEGKLTKEEFIKKFTEKNWQYAKRQLTWLKRDQSIMWFERTDTVSIKAQVQKFIS